MYSVGRIIGTAVFSTPSSILGSVGSVGASLMLWVLGFIMSFCGLFIWLEYGTMFPRSGGEKVYLEAVYKRPKYLATVVFAVNAILLGFTASGCIVSASPQASNRLSHAHNYHSRFSLASMVSCLRVTLVLTDEINLSSTMAAAGHTAGRWESRGIALGGMSESTPCQLYSPDM